MAHMDGSRLESLRTFDDLAAASSQMGAETAAYTAVGLWWAQRLLHPHFEDADMRHDMNLDGDRFAPRRDAARDVSRLMVVEALRQRSRLEGSIVDFANHLTGLAFTERKLYIGVDGRDPDDILLAAAAGAGIDPGLNIDGRQDLGRFTIFPFDTHSRLLVQVPGRSYLALGAVGASGIETPFWGRPVVSA